MPEITIPLDIPDIEIVKCPECDDHPTTTQQLEWYDQKSSCTKAYEDYLIR